jgi:hypothetical protein
MRPFLDTLKKLFASKPTCEAPTCRQRATIYRGRDQKVGALAVPVDWSPRLRKRRS